ncbi:hypothetical protein MNBD_BACTEROID01-2774 [hydrothermal vent metagenome]|uniref:Surface layer protein n=1 Tax=hydrothermal vent metagenome TaxID=652676 RepID=A0A3B0T5K2_9ZZZZ
MKKFLSYFSILLFLTAILNSCKKDEIKDLFPSDVIKGCYVVNYGAFGKGGASISKYNYDTEEMTNFFYQGQNGGAELLSNIQYAYHYNDSIFLMGNSADQVITVNPLFKQTLNGVSQDIAKPRFCVASGNYLYVSCWGTNPDWSAMPGTYIAKYNIQTRTVEKKYSLPGGPEGLEFANGNLYVALNFKDSVAVIDVTNETVAYIETPAVTSYFIKDGQDNLYVSLLSTYSNPSTETGLGYINTSTNQVEATYQLENVSSGYGSIMKPNADFSKIYVITSAYDANWNLTGAISEFDVATKSFAADKLVNDISGISGLAVNPYDDNLYIFVSESTTGIGLMKIYSNTGDFLKEFPVGASPNGAFFLE